jgi:hypothetical protein
MVSAMVVLAHDEFPPCPHWRVLRSAQLLHITGTLLASMHAADTKFCVRCIQPVEKGWAISLARWASVCTSTYVAMYAREILILSATLGITLSNSVSQRRASGQRDMTPNITGTRRVLADHECCTATGLAYTATRDRGRSEAMPLTNIIRDLRRPRESQRVFQSCVIYATTRAPETPRALSRVPHITACLRGCPDKATKSYRRSCASFHHLWPSASDCGGSKYRHRETNAGMEHIRHLS